MKTRKLIVSLITFVLILSVFAGCTNKDDNDTVVKNEPTAKPAKSTESKEEVESTEDVLVDVEIVAPWGDIPEDDMIVPAMSEATNTNLTIITPDGEYPAFISVRIASGTISDCFYVPDSGVLSNLATYARDGVALPLDDYIEDAPNLMSVIPENTWWNVTVDGSIYALPKQPQNNFSSMFVRKDWMDELGLSMPKSLDDYLNMAVAFLEADLDGNGQNDTFSVSGNAGLRIFDPIFTAYGVTWPGNTMLLDNELVYACTTAQFKEAIIKAKEFVDAGVVDPEFMTNEYDILSRMGSGNIAMIFNEWHGFFRTNHLETLAAIDPDLAFVPVPAFDGPYGKSGASYDGAGMVRLWAVNADLYETPEVIDGIMRIFDYVAAGEGNRLVCYGIEGTHYNMEGDKILPTDRISEVGYSNNLQFAGRDNMTYLHTKFSHIPEILDHCAYDVPFVYYYNTLIVPPETVNLGDIKTYETQQLLDFLYGNLDMSEYDDFINTLYETYNLQDYIDAGTAILKEKGYID